jgi:hypothetical protein
MQFFTRSPSRRCSFIHVTISGLRRRQSRVASRAHSRHQLWRPKCIRSFRGNDSSGNKSEPFEHIFSVGTRRPRSLAIHAHPEIRV